MIDSHCHLHDTEFFTDNREQFYKETVEANIGMICVGTDQRSSRQAVEFAANHEFTWAAIGVHPHDTKDGWGDVKTLLENKTENSPIVAIGEIGLIIITITVRGKHKLRAWRHNFKWRLITICQ